LTLSEREVIARGVTAHQSVRSIARLLGRSPSTVSREMSRNGGYALDKNFSVAVALINQMRNDVLPPDNPARSYRRHHVA
jgi:IS30 family transposase